MSDGYIYVMSNPAYDGLLKIGRSHEHPRRRLKELSSSSSAIYPFALEYAAKVRAHDEAEIRLHRLLSGVRVNRRREYFRLSVPEAIAMIDRHCEVIEEETHYQAPESIERARRRERRKKAIADHFMKREQESWDWRYEVNRPLVAQREELIAAQAKEVREKYTVGVLVASIAAFFVVGPLAFLVFLALTIWAVNAYEKRRVVIRDAVEAKMPTKSPQEEPARKRLRGRTVVEPCPQCERKLRLPAGALLDAACPHCKHEWRQATY